MNDPEYAERLNRVIPGGAHTYSRGDDQFPRNAPAILSHGKGSYVWDHAGKEFLDYGMALRSVTLGYAHPEVNAGAIAAIEKGNGLTRASLLELEAAETMLSYFPWADMVKFAKNGSTVTTAAVKLARAHTGRTHVAVCAQQPFFSFDDWFIGSTAVARGIPDAGKHTLKFDYHDISSLERLFAEHPGKIACVMLEPASTASPWSAQRTTVLTPDDRPDLNEATINFLQQVKNVCQKHGAVFVLDEMITGFRWHLNGAMHLYGVEPDLATFGKGMANGFAQAALIGRREIMDLGSIRTSGAERVFLASTTHGSEMSAFGAFLAATEVSRREHVSDHLWAYGKKLMDGMELLVREAGMEEGFRMHGFACSPSYTTTDRSGAVSLPLRTLWAQEMIKNGVLMPYVALSLAHGDRELERTFEAARRSLRTYSRAWEEGTENYLEGPVIKPVFRQFN